MDKITKHEKDLAICQMHTINTVLQFGGMNIDQAIRALDLDEKKFAKIARNEGIDWIADEIEKIMAKA